MKHWVRTILEDVIPAKKTLPEYVNDGLERIAEIVEASDSVHFRTRAIEEIAYEVSDCTDLQELSGLLWQAANTTGFQNFSIFVVRQGVSQTFATRMCTSYCRKWIERYQTKNYRYLDPISSKAARHDGSFLFSEANDRCPMVKSFWDDAERHGNGRNGFCYATTHSDGARIAVTFSTCASVETTKENVRLNGHDLQVLADIATERFHFLSSGGPLQDSLLTDIELKFLHNLATSPNPTAPLCNLSDMDLNHALQRTICRKLKVGTIFQAVSIASTMRWFDLLPFFPEDVVTPVLDTDVSYARKLATA